MDFNETKAKEGIREALVKAIAYKRGNPYAVVELEEGHHQALNNITNDAYSRAIRLKCE